MSDQKKSGIVWLSFSYELVLLPSFSNKLEDDAVGQALSVHVAHENIFPGDEFNLCVPFVAK